MTSYQNISEADIQGYNDCSLLMSYNSQTSLRSSQSTARSSKSSKKLSHHNLLNSSTSLNSLNNDLSSGSPSTPPMLDTGKAAAAKPPIPSLPPMRSTSNSINTPPIVTPINSSLNKEVSNNDSAEITKDQLLAQLDILKSCPTDLNDREFNHYINKINTVINSGKLNSESKIILLKYLQSSDGALAAKELMDYVLNSDGSSVWGLPLKKILENATLGK